MYKNLEDALAQIAGIAQERGDSGLVREASLAGQALLQGRFNVAFVGQFKRGKSTLINALLGREILPADVAPLTSVITIVQYGERERCLVCQSDGREQEVGLSDIFGFVAAEENPGNAKRVSEVYVELPLPLLSSGMRLVDTPGVGSIFQLNTEVTRSYLSRIDVAVFVLGSDPPISGEEIDLVRAVAPLSGHLFFVINKADLVSDSTREKAAAFTRKALAEALGADPANIQHLSALRALHNGSDSGLNEFSDRLKALSDKSNSDLARHSASRTASFLLARLDRNISLEKTAMLSPLSELEQRIENFETAMRDIDDLIAAAIGRAQSGIHYDWRVWEEQRKKVEAREKERIMKQVKSACDKASRKKIKRSRTTKKDDQDDKNIVERGVDNARLWLRRKTDLPLLNRAREKSELRRQINEQALALAREETRKFLETWTAQAAEWLSQNYNAQTDAVGRETNDLLIRVAQAAGEAFGIPIHEFKIPHTSADLGRIPFEFSEASLALDFNDWLIPFVSLFASKEKMVERATGKAGSLLEDWFMRGLYQTDSHMIDWIEKSTRALIESMTGRLSGMKKEILDAVAAGRKQQAAGEKAVSERLHQIEAHQSRLAELRKTVQAA